MIGPAVAVLRGLDAVAAHRFAEAAVAGGLPAVEVTMDSPGAPDTIASLRASLPAGVAVGAGTVVTETDLAAAHGAGASFFVAPHLDEAIVAAAVALGLACIPGVASPTELYRAVGAGAAMVKLFPASALGTGYLRALRGPYPDVAVMVSGGVTIDAAADWWRAGATVVGLGVPAFGDDPCAGAQRLMLAAESR